MPKPVSAEGLARFSWRPRLAAEGRARPADQGQPFRARRAVEERERHDVSGFLDEPARREEQSVLTERRDRDPPGRGRRLRVRDPGHVHPDRIEGKPSPTARRRGHDPHQRDVEFAVEKEATEGPVPGISARLALRADDPGRIRRRGEERERGALRIVASEALEPEALRRTRRAGEAVRDERIGPAAGRFLSFDEAVAEEPETRSLRSVRERDREGAVAAVPPAPIGEVRNAVRRRRAVRRIRVRRPRAGREDEGDAHPHGARARSRAVRDGRRFRSRHADRVGRPSERRRARLISISDRVSGSRSSRTRTSAAPGAPS